MRRRWVLVGAVIAGWAATSGCGGCGGPAKVDPGSDPPSSPSPAEASSGTVDADTTEADTEESADVTHTIFPGRSEKDLPHGPFRCRQTTCHAPDQICCETSETGRCVPRVATQGVAATAFMAASASCNAADAGDTFPGECSDSSQCGVGGYCCTLKEGYKAATVCSFDPARECAYAEPCSSLATCRVASNACIHHGCAPRVRPARCAGVVCPAGTPCCERDGKATCSKACDDGVAVTCRGPADCPRPMVCCEGNVSHEGHDPPFVQQTYCGFACWGGFTPMTVCEQDADCTTFSEHSVCAGWCGGEGPQIDCQVDAQCPQGASCLFRNALRHCTSGSLERP